MTGFGTNKSGTGANMKACLLHGGLNSRMDINHLFYIASALKIMLRDRAGWCSDICLMATNYPPRLCKNVATSTLTNFFI